MPEELEMSPPEDGNHQKTKRRVTLILLIVLAVLCLALVLLLILTFVLCIHCPKCDSDSKPPTSAPEQGFTAADSLLHFIHVSDINLDLKYNGSIPSRDLCRLADGSSTTAEFQAPFGRMGCDTPLLLLESSLKAMKNATDGKTLGFMLIAGDFSANEVIPDQERILQGIVMTVNNTHTAFPDIPVFPVFGRHDYSDPVSLQNSSDWYQAVLPHWEPLIVCDDCPGDIVKPTNSDALKKTFLEGGYYNASIADGKMILVVLNTIYWHYRSHQNDPQVQNAALKQLSWLERQLESAEQQGKRVLITGHIPPGMDIDEHEPFWLPSFTEQYMDLVVGKYHTVIAGQLFGHIHKDDFRLQILQPNKSNDSTDIKKSFALIAPCLSPDYKSNPAFRVMTLDKQKLSLTDYDQYYIDLVLTTVFSTPLWQLDYTFSKKYPSSTNKYLNADRVDELNQALINIENDLFWKAYAFSRQVNYWPEYYPRAILYCAMRYVFKKDYENCILKLHFSA